MNRVHQDRHFTVSGINGRSLVRLCAAIEPDSADGDPIVIYACLDDPSEWHRFFLDTGVAFWDITSESDIADEFADDSYRVVDCLDCSVGYVVNSAFAFERSAKHPAEIRVELSRNTSINLRCRDDRSDAGMVLTIERNTDG